MHKSPERSAVCVDDAGIYTHPRMTMPLATAAFCAVTTFRSIQMTADPDWTDPPQRCVRDRADRREIESGRGTDRR